MKLTLWVHSLVCESPDSTVSLETTYWCVVARTFGKILYDQLLALLMCEGLFLGCIRAQDIPFLTEVPWDWFTVGCHRRNLRGNEWQWVRWKTWLEMLVMEQKCLFILIWSYSKIVCHSKVPSAIHLPVVCKTELEQKYIHRNMELSLWLAKKNAGFHHLRPRFQPALIVRDLQ